MEGAGARSAILTKEDLPQGEVETEDRDRWRRWTKAPWTHEVGFVQARIREAFDLFDKDKKGTVVQEEVPTIIRYLGAYPTDKEIVHDLLPEMQPDARSSTNPAGSTPANFSATPEPGASSA